MTELLSCWRLQQEWLKVNIVCFESHSAVFCGGWPVINLVIDMLMWMSRAQCMALAWQLPMLHHVCAYQSSGLCKGLRCSHCRKRVVSDALTMHPSFERVLAMRSSITCRMHDMTI